MIRFPDNLFDLFLSDLFTFERPAPHLDPREGIEHAHQCTDCRHVWHHRDGSSDLHMCPACGTGPHLWRVAPGRGVIK